MPRHLIWDAHTKPELVRPWPLGPPGWEMPVCQIDLRPGGTYPYEWEDKGRLHRSRQPQTIRSRERFDDWTGGETASMQVFTESTSLP